MIAIHILITGYKSSNFPPFPSYNNFFIIQNRNQFEKGIHNGSDASIKSVSSSNELRSSSIWVTFTIFIGYRFLFISRHPCFYITYHVKQIKQRFDYYYVFLCKQNMKHREKHVAHLHSSKTALLRNNYFNSIITTTATI